MNEFAFYFGGLHQVVLRGKCLGGLLLAVIQRDQIRVSHMQGKHLKSCLSNLFLQMLLMTPRLRTAFSHMNPLMTKQGKL